MKKYKSISEIKTLNFIYRNHKPINELLLLELYEILVKNKFNYNLELPEYEKIYLKISSYPENDLIILFTDIANCMPEFLPYLYKILFIQYP